MKFRKQHPQLGLVTGAGGGIGAATVHRLVEEGLRVIALDRSEPALTQLAQSTPAKSMIPCLCDLQQTQDLPELIQRLLAEHGPISYLVNNAGVWPAAPLTELSPATWNLSLQVNLTAPLVLMQALAPSMQQSGGGAIVNVSSRNAFRSSTKMAAYDAAKAAVVALTRTAAGELGLHNIRVNAVCPGVIDSGCDPSINEPLFAAAYTRLIPLARYGRPEEIASTIAFLLSDEASYLTGQAIIIDGGQIACQNNQRLMEIPQLGAKHRIHQASSALCTFPATSVKR